MDLVVVALVTTQEERSSLKLLAPKNIKEMSPTSDTSAGTKFKGIDKCEARAK